MRTYDFAFVILHYITSDDTLACVNSIIENIRCKDYAIVIVDNCSPNASYQVLKNKLADIQGVFVEN